ncbi:hypothetical protein BGX27_006224 [Mortierella sp. AM989]|nr:hypothetical protein BGX27_006224 [Mortierella sp. AM989]
MPFFKFNNSSSKKNKTASVPNTPRTSIQLNASDVAAINKETLLNPVDACEMLPQNGASLTHFQAMAISRI